jgi:type II secretory pathway pseudopilin PulG
MKHSTGFVLLELMMALIVVMILAAAIVSAFAVGLRAWDNTQRQADYHQENSALLETIGGDLRGAWLGDNHQGFFKLETSGGNSTLSFTTFAPVKESGGLDQLVAVTYRLEGGELLRSQKLLEADETTEPEEEVVGEKVESFTLRAGEPDNLQEQWVVPAQTGAETESGSTGDTLTDLPHEVEVRVQLSDTALGKPAQLRAVTALEMAHP